VESFLHRYGWWLGGGGFFGGGSGAMLYYQYGDPIQIMPAGGGGGSSYVAPSVSDPSQGIATATEGSVVVSFS
jgi:hypothetical protein